MKALTVIVDSIGWVSFAMYVLLGVLDIVMTAFFECEPGVHKLEGNFLFWVWVCCLVISVRLARMSTPGGEEA